MSTLSSPPPFKAAPRERRRVHALDERRPAWRVGLAGTVVAHLALVLGLLMLPKDIFESDRVSFETDGERNRPFEIELKPEWLRPVTPVVEPVKFVEVNPAAPENAPDTTSLFGAQNQQVAQPKPTPDGLSETPALDGEGREGATALVSGLSKEPAAPSVAEALEQLFKPERPAEAAPDPAEESRAERERAAEAAKAVNALPGGETLLGKSDGGVGSTVARLVPVPGAEAGAEPTDGAADAKASTGGRKAGGGYFAGTPAIDPKRPQERPRLAAAAVNARSTPTIKNEFGTKNIGAVAYDAKWSAYGEYLQRLIDAVQAQWERLILRSAFYPTEGARVRVVFKLGTAGTVTEVVAVDGSGGELAQRLCVSAITERAPYGDWTDDMIAVLGKEQEITFTFFYR